MIDRGARRRLPAFVEPEGWHHAGVIGPPHARHEAGIGRGCHDAGRRSHDIGEAVADISHCAGGVAASDRPDSAGMRIDQRGADRRPRVQAEIISGFLREPGSKRRARRDNPGSDPDVFVDHELFEADPLKIGRAPPPFVRQIIPLARHRARRARRRPRRAERQIIGQIEEVAGAVEACAEMAFQPEQLRDLHLRRNGAADIAQDVILSIVDQSRFRGRAMIHPDDDVAPVVAGCGHRHRRAALVQHHQRASRIEPDALHGVGPYRRLGDRAAHRGRAGVPDIRRRLLDDVAGLVPDLNRMSRGRKQVSCLVEHPRARTGRSDIDADIGLPHFRSRRS